VVRQIELPRELKEAQILYGSMKGQLAEVTKDRDQLRENFFESIDAKDR
jgi:hypothetical protein